MDAYCNTLVTWVGIIAGLVIMVFTVVNIIIPYILTKNQNESFKKEISKNIDDFNKTIEQHRNYTDDSLNDIVMYFEIVSFRVAHKDSDVIPSAIIDKFENMAKSIKDRNLNRYAHLIIEELKKKMV